MAASILALTYLLSRSVKEFIQDINYISNTRLPSYSYESTKFQERQQLYIALVLFFGFLSIWFSFVEALLVLSLRYLQKLEFNFSL